MEKITAKSASLALVFLACGVHASAQELTPGQDPAAEAQRYEQDVEKARKALEREQPKAPEIDIEREKAKPVIPGPTFVLKKVNVIGATVFKPKDFEPIYAPYLGKEVSFSDIQTIVEKIGLKYKNKGYLTTIVYIPVQEIREGAVEIRVAEGKMGQLKIEGNKWFSGELIKKFVHSRTNEILDIKTLERDILRLNRNPDLQVGAAIAPGEEPQTSDITLLVKDRFPWHSGVMEDNLGSRLTGKYRSTWLARSSNVSGSSDTLFLSSLYSGRSFGELASYNFPLGTYGTTSGLDVVYFWSSVGREFKSFDIKGETLIFTPHVTKEIALTESFESYANLGIGIKSVTKSIQGDTSSDEQLRIPYIGLDISSLDPQGQTSFSPKLDFGTSGFLGATSRGSSKLSRPDSGGFFVKYEQSLNRLQRAFLDSYVTVRSRFQAASHTLSPSEQIQLGGMDSVRGYPEGDYLADIGGVLNVDWVFPMYLIPIDWKLPRHNVPLRFQIQPVLFTDIGAGELQKVQQGEREKKFLAGIGGGLLLNFKYMSTRLYWADNVGDKPASGAGPAVFYFSFLFEI